MTRIVFLLLNCQEKFIPQYRYCGAWCYNRYSITNNSQTTHIVCLHQSDESESYFIWFGILLLSSFHPVCAFFFSLFLFAEGWWYHPIAISSSVQGPPIFCCVCLLFLFSWRHAWWIVCHHFLSRQQSEVEGKKNEIVVDLLFLSTIANWCNCFWNWISGRESSFPIYLSSLLKKKKTLYGESCTFSSLGFE